MSTTYRERERERDWDDASNDGGSRSYTTVRRYKIPDRTQEDAYDSEPQRVHQGRSPSRERVERREYTVERDDLLRREVREYYYLERNVERSRSPQGREIRKVERSQSPTGREILEYRYEPEVERVIYPPREYRDTYESKMRLQEECIPDIPAAMTPSSSISEQCHHLIVMLKAIVEGLSSPDKQGHKVSSAQVGDELERFSLWVGNIGALHAPNSPLSLESRLAEAEEVLKHVFDLLDDMNEVAEEFSNIIHGAFLGDVAVETTGESSCDENQNEETELLEEIGSGIARLFRVSKLIRGAAPTDLFIKALSRDRYRFNDQYDIAHVGEKYPKLASEDSAWLRTRLGRAITHRRQYLSYIRDHRDKLEGKAEHEESKLPKTGKQVVSVSDSHPKQLLPHDTASRPSTYFTKASTLAPEKISSVNFDETAEFDNVSDAGSYTTISRSVNEDHESSSRLVIPKLEDLKKGSKDEVECPFCYRMKTFKNNRIWRKHVYSDLRTYVCTFPDCDAPYFGSINDWFRHELLNHRVRYKCRLCQNKSFANQKGYMRHVVENHDELLELGDENSVLKLGQESLDVISAEDCPCCSDWTSRLRLQVLNEERSKTSATAIKVVPTVFKRHLASHLEQLALFAINISVQDDETGDSNAAIRDDLINSSKGYNSSISSFHSVPGSLEASDQHSELFKPDFEQSVSTNYTDVMATEQTEEQSGDHARSAAPGIHSEKEDQNIGLDSMEHNTTTDMASLLMAIQATMQLSDQATRILRRLRRSYERQKGLLEVLKRYESELNSVRAIIGIIEDEEELRTVAISETIFHMKDILYEVSQLLSSVDPQPSGTKQRGNVIITSKSFTRGSIHEKRLCELMDKLGLVTSTLMLCIQAANVGVRKSAEKQFVADVGVVQRIDTVLKGQIENFEGLRIGQLLRGRRPSNNGSVPLTRADLKSLIDEDTGEDSDIDDSAIKDQTLLEDSESRKDGTPAIADRNLLRNIARDQALQINGSLGDDIWKEMNHLVIRDNVAESESVQINYDVNLDAMEVLMEQQRARMSPAPPDATEPRDEG